MGREILSVTLFLLKQLYVLLSPQRKKNECKYQRITNFLDIEILTAPYDNVFMNKKCWVFSGSMLHRLLPYPPPPVAARFQSAVYAI